MNETGRLRTVLKRWQPLLMLLALMWALEVVNFVSGRALNGFGIVPREVSGLPGILAAPFLHGSLSHIMANTAALLVLGGLLALRGARAFVGVTAALAVISGLAVWCFARPAVHIGASGVIFGYFGYLVALGWYERTPAALFTALVVAFIYGGMLWGLMPSGNGVSWEAHVAGFGAGILAASWQARRV